MSEQTTPAEQKSPLKVFANIAAVAFAVRMNRKGGSDFREGTFKQFVIGSLAFTAVFIASVYAVVQAVLPG